MSLTFIASLPFKFDRHFKQFDSSKDGCKVNMLTSQLAPSINCCVDRMPVWAWRESTKRGGEFRGRGGICPTSQPRKPRILTQQHTARYTNAIDSAAAVSFLGLGRFLSTQLWRLVPHDGS
jgi:hypothetical protein